jgi:probable HAF family extracellular repeat protein
MDRRYLILPAALLAGLSLACRDDGPSPTGVSPEQPTAAAAATTYSIKNLGTLGGIQSAAYAINNVGQTVGYSVTKTDKFHAFIHHAGVRTDLGALSGGTSVAYDINDAGVVVGSSPLLSGAERAVRWQNGMKQSLGTLGGRNSQANAINGDGVIVGWSETRSGDTHAFVYRNGVMKDIGTLGGTESRANDINGAGRVVGVSTTASGERHAFSWRDGKFQDLGTDGTESAGADAVNNGRIVGCVGAPPDAEGGELEISSPFVFAAGAFTTFGTGQISSCAEDVNPDGIVVGYDFNARLDEANDNAWVRAGDGPARYLPELTDGFAAASGINRYGTIVGYSSTADGWPKAVIWRPQ